MNEDAENIEKSIENVDDSAEKGTGNIKNEYKGRFDVIKGTGNSNGTIRHGK